MSTVLLATEKPFDPQAVAGIREIVEQAGHTFVLLEKYKESSQLLAAAAEADAMIVRSDKIGEEVFAAAPRLKLVVRAGAGYDTIDLAAATRHGVIVENTPGQNADAVAELALALMLFQARAHFDGGNGTELKGKTLGLHAFGNVGSRVAHLALGFGMQVYAFDPFLSDEVISAAGVTPVHSAEELYSNCQYVSLHIPAIAATLNSINYALLSRMPQPAVLVNTARAEVIDESDLLKIFAENAQFQYVADVAPLCQAELMEKYPQRCFFTPKKIGAQTVEANVNAGFAAAAQIAAFYSSGDTRFQVNR